MAITIFTLENENLVTNYFDYFFIKYFLNYEKRNRIYLKRPTFCIKQV